MKIAWKTINGYGPYAYLQRTVGRKTEHVEYLGKVVPGSTIDVHGEKVLVPAVPDDAQERLRKPSLNKSKSVAQRGFPLGSTYITDRAFKRLPGFVDKYDLQPSEFESFKHYFGSINAWEINDALRKGEPLSGYQKNVLDTIAKYTNRNAALTNRVVFRGERREKALPDYNPGDIVKLYAPASTSLNTDVARFHALNDPLGKKPESRVFYEIHGVDKAKTLITEPMEREVLIGPGVSLEIVDARSDVTVPKSKRHAEMLPGKHFPNLKADR